MARTHRLVRLLVLPAAVALAATLALAPRMAFAQAPDLFISEYTEGTSFNKAIEIYNATGAPVNLAAGNWVIELYSNGAAAPTGSVALTGVIANGDVYVVANTQSGAALMAAADQLDATAINWNGDDAIALRKGGVGGTLVDVFGQIGVDPGTEWGTGLQSTQDNTLRRKVDVCQGDTNGGDVFDPSVEWDGFAVDTFDGFGAHVSNCLAAATAQFLQSNAVMTVTDPAGCTGPGDYLSVTTAITNTGDGDAVGVEIIAAFEPVLQGVAGSCFFTGGRNGSCSVESNRLIWRGDIPGTAGAPDNVLSITYEVRVAGGTRFDTEACIGTTLFYSLDEAPDNEEMLKFGACITVNCPPTVDPNRQLGGQVHLPILNFIGQDDVCTTWIEIQNIGDDIVKAALITWAEPGFCPPQAAGPLKVECTGLMSPGSTWNMVGAQIPTGSKGGILFKFSGRQFSFLGIDVGEDDIVADFLCETLFFGVVGDADDYRRFKKAYNEGLVFEGVPLNIAQGRGILAADVHRTCPGDQTPGVSVTSKYNGMAGSHLGKFDPVYGGYTYYVPLVQANAGGFNTILYIQNGGLGCSSVEIWFKGREDCIRASICDILTLAAGETYQFNAADCVGPDFQGNAWLRATQPLAIAVDILGHDVLMTYIGEPGEINYTFDPKRSVASDGSQVVFGPLMYSEYQGWDTGVQVQNLSAVTAAKIKVYFLDRGGDIITTLVDWVCPRGSQTLFLPVVADLPGNWVGSIRVESQEWVTPGAPNILSPNIVAVATLIKYIDSARTSVTEAIAYNLLPEHKVYDWQIGANAGGLESGVGLIAVPSLLRDLEKSGMTSELAIANVVPKPGFTDLVIYLYDQNGLLDYVCQKLNEKQVEYIDLQTWGFVHNGFKGSAIISAFFWEHDVFDEQGQFVRNLVGLGAVAIERRKTHLGEDVPGDEAAGDRGIPFREQDVEGAALGYLFLGPAPLCPGFPEIFRPANEGECPATITAACANCPLPLADPGRTTLKLRVNVPAKCQVDDVNVVLDIDHGFNADLDVDLISPGLNAKSSRLFDDICGNTDNVNVLLDDDAGTPIGVVCPPSGVVQSESGTALKAFDGAQAGGDWTLAIEDDFAGTAGTLQNVELRLKIRIP
ncbi:MAG: lamin tail domain-containing protein [Ardenticatenales bacterium]|nr:lamin tail domain-containing protein [Ardenticatenales bacterium]